jgi:class 3 adenylate cyclase/pimeloyl-ACP methyl ester carboxylesterase
MDAPAMQYAKTSDGVSIAYCVAGEGPTLVRSAPPGVTHVQRDWAMYPAILDPLARELRVVLYDARGTGLSDRGATDFSLEAMTRDLEAVVHSASEESVALVGFHDFVLPSIAFAARHPDLVSKLILIDGWATPSDMLESAANRMSYALLEEDWVLYTETLARVLLGFDDPQFAAAFAEHYRASIEQDAARSFATAERNYDVSALLSRVRVPTLVLQNRGSPVVSVAGGQRIAAAIPGARFRIIDDANYQHVASLIIDFVNGETKATETVRAQGAGTAIILFLDIAGSTELTTRIGDAAYREKERELDVALRSAIREAGGSPVEGKVLGDGVMATFSSASNAIQAALACQTLGGGAGLALHAGIHAGDVLREGNNVHGGAVQVAARIADASASGEVFVSQTVRELARTSAGVSFEDRGERELKGVSEPVRVFAVRSALRSA